MKKLLLLAVALFFAASAHAQSTSSTWRDVTAAPYSVAKDCSASASSGINSAISAAPPTGNGSVVVFFPAGCYLIDTQLIDTNSAANITYLGFGNVELRAKSSPAPPHAANGQQWNVFNSGTGNVSLVCDSGTISGQSSLSITSQTGKTVTSDGTNCFAH